MKVDRRTWRGTVGTACLQRLDAAVQTLGKPETHGPRSYHSVRSRSQGVVSPCEVGVCVWGRKSKKIKLICNSRWLATLSLAGFPTPDY